MACLIASCRASHIATIIITPIPHPQSAWCVALATVSPWFVTLVVNCKGWGGEVLRGSVVPVHPDGVCVQFVGGGD